MAKWYVLSESFKVVLINRTSSLKIDISVVRKLLADLLQGYTLKRELFLMLLIDRVS
jgi:hypothetical protein